MGGYLGKDSIPLTLSVSPTPCFGLLVGGAALGLTVAVSVLGQDEGHTVKYNPLPEGVPEGEARGNS